MERRANAARTGKAARARWLRPVGIALRIALSSWSGVQLVFVLSLVWWIASEWDDPSAAIDFERSPLSALASSVIVRGVLAGAHTTQAKIRRACGMVALSTLATHVFSRWAIDRMHDELRSIPLPDGCSHSITRVSIPAPMRWLLAPFGEIGALATIVLVILCVMGWIRLRDPAPFRAVRFRPSYSERP